MSHRSHLHSHQLVGVVFVVRLHVNDIIVFLRVLLSALFLRLEEAAHTCLTFAASSLLVFVQSKEIVDGEGSHV